jgi:hypothetical protein
MAKIGPRDNQKSKLYRGERNAFRQFFNATCEDMDEAQALVIAMWRRADVPDGVPAPVLKRKDRLKVSAHYLYGNKHVIGSNPDTLDGEGLSLAVLAHGVLNANGLTHLVQPHGPEFAFTYARTLDTVTGEEWDLATGIRLLRAEGLEVSSQLLKWTGDYYSWLWQGNGGFPILSKGKKAMEREIQSSKFNRSDFKVCKTTPNDFFNVSSH